MTIRNEITKMAPHDEHNLTLVESPQQVDDENASFYNRFPYPWQPATFDFSDDPGLYTQLLNQNLGSYTEQAIPREAHIWVAGCGTNQGIYTGLRFPEATIIGSDLSASSLALGSQIGAQIGLQNLVLREESINQSSYRECFDYVICTGVVHHNADPAQTVRKLAQSLKPTGILELMVYNRYHRLLPQAFQKTVRLLNVSGNMGLRGSSELLLARKLMRSFKARNLMYDFLNRLQGVPEPELADVLIQPVEYSYAIDSLVDLADSCGLELLAPCANAQDGNPLWHVEFKDVELKRDFESLPDISRWQVVNLLLLEQSPMLWFYLQRKDSPRLRLPEHEINNQFMACTFEPIKANRRCYVKKQNGDYELSAQEVPFQRGSPDRAVAKIYNAVDGKTPMRDIFKTLGVAPEFSSVLCARANLATLLCPYLKAVSA